MQSEAENMSIEQGTTLNHRQWTFVGPFSLARVVTWAMLVYVHKMNVLRESTPHILQPPACQTCPVCPQLSSFFFHSTEEKPHRWLSQWWSYAIVSVYRTVSCLIKIMQKLQSWVLWNLVERCTMESEYIQTPRHVTLQFSEESIRSLFLGLLARAILLGTDSTQPVVNQTMGKRGEWADL